MCSLSTFVPQRELNPILKGWVERIECAIYDEIAQEQLVALRRSSVLAIRTARARFERRKDPVALAQWTCVILWEMEDLAASFVSADEGEYGRYEALGKVDVRLTNA